MGSPTIQVNPQDVKNFSEQFEDEAAALANPAIAQATGYGRGKQNPAMLSGARRDNWESVNALETSLRGVPIPPATIWSVCPWPLTINGVHHSDIIVNACPVDQPQGVKYTIRKYKMDRKELGEDRGSFTPIFPIQLAEEFQKHYSETGGVVVYAGDHDPSKDKKLQEKMDAAVTQLHNFLTTLYQEAEDEMRRPGGPNRRNIGPQHRDAAAWLFHRGQISDKPKWLSVTRQEAALQEACPSCKFDQNKTGALRCMNQGCGFVLDPYNAFLNAMIGPDDPKDRLALSRLSREQLDTLGLNDIKSLEERVPQPKKHKKEKKEE